MRGDCPGSGGATPYAPAASRGISTLSLPPLRHMAASAGGKPGGGDDVDALGACDDADHSAASDGGKSGGGSRAGRILPAPLLTLPPLFTLGDRACELLMLPP
mmetsp:Transcript_54876/g.134501  ORF Transcript_54876/g.134501 Transcript_54876/m.134501 type:complete len:103 (-) Transcript_54876:9-317(-)